MSKKYKIVMLAGAIVAVMLIVAAIVIGMHNQAMAAYSAKLDEADKMLAAEDYSNAVLKYQEAISDQPEEEEGYLRLAVAYEVSGNPDYAKTTIQNALTILPGNERLTEKLSQMEGDNIKTNALALDNSLLTTLSSKSFYDYGKTNGVEKVTVIKDGAIAVRIKGVNADLIFRNTSEQPNAVSGNGPNPDSLPAEVHFDNILAVFGGVSSMTIDDLKDLGVKDAKVVSHQDYGKAVTFTHELYSFTIECDEEGTVREGAANSVLIPTPSVKAGGNVEIKGVAINAVTGDGIDNAKLTFVKGSDKYEVSTDSSGHFQAKLGAGDYTVECRAEGFIEENKNVYVPSYSNNWTCEIVMSPEINAKEARFVLTWDSAPADLDSHLVGNGVHTSWLHMEEGDIASLDLDDTNGYGPETTTLYDLNGHYTFVVHNYSQDAPLADCGAEVTVYLPGEEPVTISIGGDGAADTWVVCEIDNGKLNVINEIQDYGLDLIM